MKLLRSPFALLTVVAALFAGCNPASDLADHEGIDIGTDQQALPFDDRAPKGEATCPCFSVSSLSNTDRMLAADGSSASDYYLLFDVFDYYGLDARRTEARGLVSTSAGLFEEVASVYITRGSEDELFLICHRQEVVHDPISGDPEYRYDTLAPTLQQAEACRQVISTSVGEQAPCQGPACGMAYTKEQLDPEYPPYHDGNYRSPETLLDGLRQQVADVGRLLQPS